MLVGERVLGILAVASYSVEAFDEADINLLSSIASQAALDVENARQHAAVKEQARRDSLTGALNHSAFLAQMDEAMQKAAAATSKISLIMMDVDDFKLYNDTYGHQVGDEVLIQIVKKIETAIPSDGFIGRWGERNSQLLFLG